MLSAVFFFFFLWKKAPDTLQVMAHSQWKRSVDIEQINQKVM